MKRAAIQQWLLYAWALLGMAAARWRAGWAVWRGRRRRRAYNRKKETHGRTVLGGARTLF